MLFFSQPGPARTPARSYEELRNEGRKALEAGRLAEALELFQEALERAREREDENLVDRAVYNCSIALIALGRSREIVPELRQILVRNTGATICSMAAYNLSRAHETDKEYKKGLFYARIARDRAIAAGRDDLLVGSYNLIGNCLMADSFFAEAAEDYERALALLPEEVSAQRAMVLANLGYCLMNVDRLRPGMRLSFTALRWFRLCGARLYEVTPQLDLCYAYLELGRYRRAREHGLCALDLAEETGEVECIKNALFLLGDTERSAGDLDAAWGYFATLQRRYYPESPQVVEYMVRMGLRQVVNLRA